MSPRQEPARGATRQARRSTGPARGAQPSRQTSLARARASATSPLAGGPRAWSPLVWRQVISLALLAVLAILGLVLVGMSSNNLPQAVALSIGVLVVVFSAGVLRFRR